MTKLFALAITLIPVLLVASFVQLQPGRRQQTPKKTDSLMSKHLAPSTRFGVFITDGNGLQTTLRITSMKATTDIRGTLATTALEIVVLTPNDRILEGQFSFPISDGQTVSRFALDLNGKLRDAVVVDKSKARATFEAIERKGVDPALLEWTRDNAFRTRIYPINPRSTRRILIAYEQELTQGPDGLQYTLPIAVDDTVDAFSWDVDVAAFGSVPQLSGNSTEQIPFSNRGRQFTSSVTRTKFLIKQPFVIDVPVDPAAQVVTVNEQGSETFASVVVAGPQTTQQAVPRPLPKSITIAWDASLSGDTRDHEKELVFFDAYFARNRDVEVNLHVFAHEMIREQRFSVLNGRWDDLRRVLTNLTYDGATQLGAVPFNRFPGELTFLVSDGLSTFGLHKPEMGTTPVIGIVSSTLADIDLLRFLCTSSGGRVYDLRVTSVEDALSSIFTSRVMLASVRVVEGEMETIYPTASVEAGLCTTIVGKLKSASASLELTYTLNGAIIDRRSVVINATEHRVEGQTAARQWAQQELKTMAGDRRARAKDITQLGMRFGIVTPGTSLLVLETLNDYVQYDIQPPASEPQLLAQWREQKSSRPTIVPESPESRLGYLTGLVNAWKTWYDASHDSKPVPALAKGAQGPLAAPMRSRMRVSETEEVNVQSFSGGVGSVARLSAVSDDAVAPAAPSPAHNSIAREEPSTSGGDIIRVAPINRDAWIGALKACTKESIYSWYLDNRGKYRLNTGFFLDVSDALREKGLRSEALRVLTNLAELEGENHQMMRILARRLLQLDQPAYAIDVFTDVREIRDEEPQSYRDLALALDAAGKHQQAVDLLYSMALRKWDTRFPEVELIALNEMNHIIGKYASSVNVSAIPAVLRYSVASDIRVVMDWDSDNCDIDLWVLDPNKEKCYYGHRFTGSGGRLSSDLTGGYGPEEFMQKKATKGTFAIQANYFGDRQQRLAGPTTIQVTVYRNYGMVGEQKISTTVRLSGKAQVVDLATLVIN